MEQQDKKCILQVKNLHDASSTSTSSLFSIYIIYIIMNAHVMLMKMQR